MFLSALGVWTTKTIVFCVVTRGLASVRNEIGSSSFIGDRLRVVVNKVVGPVTLSTLHRWRLNEAAVRGGATDIA
jgi:hypothetical protein